MDAMAYDFPSDLIEASRTCASLRAQLEALPLDELSLTDGTPIERRQTRPVKAYSDDDLAEVAKLRAARLKAAEMVVCHRFWATVDAGEQAKARSALKHVGDAA